MIVSRRSTSVRMRLTKSRIVSFADLIACWLLLISTQRIGDKYRLYLGAKRDGINYNREIFDPVYMLKLLDLGYEMAKNGYPWANTPSGMD